MISRSSVSFTVDVHAVDEYVKPLMGLCDIDLIRPGLQLGVPSVEHGVMIKTLIVGKPFEELEFLEGWCN